MFVHTIIEATLFISHPPHMQETSIVHFDSLQKERYMGRGRRDEKVERW